MLPPLEYLKSLKPFSFLSDSELKEILDGLESEIFERGKIIFKRGKKPVKYVYILKYGKVELNDGKNSEILTEGDMFGIASAITGNPPRFTAKALDKSVCFLIRRESFLKVFNSNQKFSEFFTKLLERRLVSLLKLSKKTSSDLNMLYTAKVSDLISKRLVYCSPKTKIAEAAKIMHENRVGSIVIIENGKPVGIFTQKDLIRLVANNVPLDEEVSKHMSSPVVEIDADATVMDTYLAMTSSGINHIVVVSNGDVKGVISTRDILLKLGSSSSLLSLSRRIPTASIEELKEILSAVVDSVEDLISRGFDFSELAKISSGIYDLVIKRVLKRFGSNLCWIQIGKSGRRENIYPEVFGVVLNAKTDDIRLTLERIGFRIVNLESYTLDDWREIVRSLIANPNARKISMYLDGRFLYGDKRLYWEWKSEISKLRSRRIAKVLATSNGTLPESLLNCLKAVRILGINGDIVRELEEAYSVVMDIELRRSFGISKVDEILLKEASKILQRAKEMISAL